MVMSITAASQLSLGSQIEVGKLRRILNAELGELGKILSSSGLSDEKTLLIKKWKEEFLSKLNQNDEKSVLKKYIDYLKQILIGSVPCLNEVSLDEDSILGSDGITYGFKSYIVYLYSIPPAERKCSPTYRGDQTPFTFKPHPIVRHMFKWLEKHGESVHCEKTEKAYLNIDPEIVASLKSEAEASNDPEKNSLKQMMQRQLKVCKEINDVVFQEKKLRNNIVGKFRNDLSEINRKEEIDSKESLENLEESKRKYEVQVSQIHTHINEFRKGIEELEAESKDLKAKINNVGNGISEAEREDLKLRDLIVDMKIKIKKRNEAWLKAAVISVAIIGGCGLATLALPTLVGSSATASIGVTPMSMGAKIGITILF